MEKHLIPNRVGYKLRPIEANLKLEIRHFEADTISLALLVLVDKLH